MTLNREEALHKAHAYMARMGCVPCGDRFFTHASLL